MFNNNNFYGEIEGKKIEDYIKDLDYSIDNVEDRINFVKDKLGIHKVNGIETADKIWEDVFTQKGEIKLNTKGIFYIEDLEKPLNYKEFIEWCNENDYIPEEYLYENDYEHKSSWREVGDTSHIKLHLNATDALYSESNVARTLETLASYILAKDKEVSENEEKIKTYNSRELFLRAIKEEATMKELTPNSESTEFAVFKMEKNYKKEIKDKVTAEDVKKYPEVKAYIDAYNINLAEYKALGKKESLTNEESERKYYLKKTLSSLKVDALDTKLAFERPIKWKQALKDNGCPNWDYLDLMDREHIKCLLQIPLNEDLQNDLACIRTDLESLIKRTKFTDRQKEVLDLWMRDIPLYDNKEKNIKGMPYYLGITGQRANELLNLAIDRIINTYIEELEDWYYLNINKGEYKKCSKCGEIKLVQRFQKNGNRYRGSCKECSRK
ncbi:hypothetical protein [Fusobacterium sp.]|uniref:hypothetical protein n=1 Tax=Fusobacterium sp. TaxID=68766 RepID=UPI00262FF0B4|nr:hypothetical protein [Fusobacterium sp.]